jgi:DNA-directed RNA polymerase alpha subunit
MTNKELMDLFALEITRSCASSGAIGRGPNFAKNVYDIANDLMIARQRILKQWIDDEQSITTLGLGARVENVLHAEKIFSVKDLQDCSLAELLNMPNMGRKSAEQVKFQMNLFGWKLQGEE